MSIKVFHLFILQNRLNLFNNLLETEAVSICRDSISRIEDQSRTVTDIELAGFAKVFRVPISELFE